MSYESRLKELGIVLPPPPTPAGSYVPARRAGNLLYVSGTLCTVEGKLAHTGKVGLDLDIGAAQDAARICALNTLAAVRAAVGTLDAVKQIVLVNGFVNGVPGFADSPLVINGASDLFVELFGPAGQHARAAVAVAGLPRDSAVEIQVVFEVS